MRKSRKIIGAIALTILLFANGMTAFAMPQQAANPVWSDVWELMDYVGSNFYPMLDSEEICLMEMTAEELSAELPYLEPGKYMPLELEIQYAQLVDNYWIPGSDGKEGEDAVDGEAYHTLYAAVQALFDGIQTSNGEKCTWDLDGTWDELWRTVEKINDMFAAEKLICVGPDETAPDVNTMDRGTYWIASDYAEHFWEEAEAVGNAGENWIWGDENTKREILRSEYLEQISRLEAAIRTVTDNWNEGTIGTAVESITVPTVHKSSESKAEAEAPVIVNQVIASDGTKIASSIEGIFSGGSIGGISFRGDKNDILTAAGISQEEAKNGVICKYYVCDTTDQAAKQTISGLAAAEGLHLEGVSNYDLYRLDNGTVTKLRRTPGLVTITAAIPGSQIKTGRSFVLIGCDENGNKVLLKDLDNDDKMITVETDLWGVFGLAWY